MLLLMKLGDKLIVELEGADTEIVLDFNEREFSIHVDMPDSDQRVGKIYSERYAEDMEKQLTGLLKKEIIDLSNSAEQIRKDFGDEDK